MTDWSARKRRALAHIHDHGVDLTSYAADDRELWTGENETPPTESLHEAPAALRERYERYRALGGKKWETKGTKDSPPWTLADVPLSRVDRVCALLDEAIQRFEMIEETR